MLVNPRRRMMAAVATVLLAAGCGAFSKAPESGEDACERYAVQYVALKKIEAEHTMAVLGGDVRPDELVASPANIALAAPEVEPRCKALSKDDHACVAQFSPVIDEYLQAHDACDDRACKTAAGEAVQAKITEDCRKVIRGLDCLQTQDCKPAR